MRTLDQLQREFDDWFINSTLDESSRAIYNAHFTAYEMKRDFLRHQELRQLYPALQSAWDQYMVIYRMCDSAHPKDPM